MRPALPRDAAAGRPFGALQQADRLQALHARPGGAVDDLNHCPLRHPVTAQTGHLGSPRLLLQVEHRQHLHDAVVALSSPTADNAPD